jgi:hypothetical protein
MRWQARFASVTTDDRVCRIAWPIRDWASARRAERIFTPSSRPKRASDPACRQRNGSSKLRGQARAGLAGGTIVTIELPL